MMTNNIICFHGVSNVGKTTISQRLATRIGAAWTTPIRKLKRFLEEVYGYEYGDLDTQEGKYKLMGAYSSGQVLRDLYHFFRERDGSFASRCLEADLQEEGHTDIVIESIRNPEEIATIKRHAQAVDAYIIVFKVDSRDGVKYSTDAQLNMNLQHYPPDTPILEIENDRALQSTMEDITEWYRSLALTARHKVIETAEDAFGL